MCHPPHQYRTVGSGDGTHITYQAKLKEEQDLAGAQNRSASARCQEAAAARGTRQAGTASAGCRRPRTNRRTTRSPP
eukprot:3414081-Prymnesium_polylepis.1